jgi:trimeric autotransporter adhesin
MGRLTIAASYNGSAQTAPLAVKPAAPAPFTFSISPFIVYAGQTAHGTITLKDPALAGGATITLTSDTNYVGFPAEVTVAKGETVVTFTIATKNVPVIEVNTFKATYKGAEAGAVLTVRHYLTGLDVAPALVIAGQSSTGTVTLANAAPAGGITVNLFSDNAAAKVPATVLIAEGAASKAFQITTNAVNATVNATITATFATVVKTAQLEVKPAPSFTLTLAPTSLYAGQASTGTVTLNAPAPGGGAEIALSVNSASVGVPANLTIPAGKTSGTFNITTQAASTITTAAIRAAYKNASLPANLTVNHYLGNLSVSPAVVTAGQTSTGTVTLTKAAPTGGLSVALSCSNPAAQIPATVLVKAGATTATFTINAGAVAAINNTQIAASLLGIDKLAAFSIKPAVAALVSVTLTPATVVGGNPVGGKVTLSAAEPAGGIPVTLVSTNAAAQAQVPASVLVAAGSTFVTFTVKTTAVDSEANTMIQGNLLGANQSATLTVTPVPVALQSLTLSPKTVVGGKNNSTATVTLTTKAPAGGIIINIKSNSGAATIPATVTVAAGAATAAFTVTTAKVAMNGTAQITASYNGVTKAATLGLTVK